MMFNGAYTQRSMHRIADLKVLCKGSFNVPCKIILRINGLIYLHIMVAVVFLPTRLLANMWSLLPYPDIVPYTDIG